VQVPLISVLVVLVLVGVAAGVLLEVLLLVVLPLVLLVLPVVLLLLVLLLDCCAMAKFVPVTAVTALARSSTVALRRARLTIGVERTM
jgi:hypothetical protein